MSYPSIYPGECWGIMQKFLLPCYLIVMATYPVSGKDRVIVLYNCSGNATIPESGATTVSNAAGSTTTELPSTSTSGNVIPLLQPLTTTEASFVADGFWRPPKETTSSPNTGKSTPSPLTVEDAVDTLLKAIETKTQPDEDTTSLMFDGLKAALNENKNPTWVAKIYSLPPILPPVNATDWLRFQVKLEVFLTNNLDKIEAHKASAQYPGKIGSLKDNDLAKAYIQNVTLETQSVYTTLLKEQCTESPTFLKFKNEGKLSCDKFCSTLLYAPAGSTVKIKLVGNTSLTSAEVRIGHYEDTTGNELWRQYPNMGTKKVFNGTEILTLNTAFGGIVYIGKVRTEVDAIEISFEIRGVVESPSWKLGLHTLVDWRDEVILQDAPFGDLVSDQLILTLPKAVIQHVEDPEEILLHWERILDDLTILAAMPYKSYKPRHHIAPTRDLPNDDARANMHSGWPIMVLEKHFEEFTDYNNLWKQSPLTFGLLHELGHNYEKTMPYLDLLGVEVKPDIFTDYIQVIGHNVPMGKVRPEYSMESIAQVLGDYLENGPDFKLFVTSGVSRVFHFDMIRNFGWDTYVKLADAAKGANDTGLDSLAIEVSKIQGERVDEYLQSWGIPVAKAVGKVKNLEDCGYRATDLLKMARIEVGKMKGRGMRRGGGGIEGTTKSPEPVDVNDGDATMTTSTLPPLVEEVENVNETFLSTNPLWRVKLNESATDYDQLIGDIQEVRIDYAYRLLPFGPTAFSVVLTLKNFTVMAASKHGKGRILYSDSAFLGHPWWLKLDSEALLINCISWVGSRYKEKKQKILVQSDGKSSKESRLFTFLKQSGNDIEQFAFDDPKAYAKLSKANVLVAPYVDLIQPDAVSEIKKFLEVGGGLMIGCSKDCGDVAINQPLSAFTGIVWVKETQTKNTKHKIHRPMLRYTALPEAVKDIKIVLKFLGEIDIYANVTNISNPIPLADMKAMINLLQLATENLPPESLTWGSDLKKQFLTLPAVQIDKGTISSTPYLELRVKIDLLMMNYILKPEDRYLHPWSKHYPGWVNESMVDLTQTLRHTFYLKRHDVYHTLLNEGCENSEAYKKLVSFTKTSCTGWCPTPYYLQAGKITKIRLIGGNVTKFSVYTGWLEDFTYRPKWPHYPKIDYFHKFIGNEGEFSTSFGGTLLLKDIVSSVDADRVELEVSGGATEMAHFFLGKTTLSEWRRVKKFQDIAPWMILTAPSISLRFPSRRFNVAQNPEELMNTWERIVDNANEFHSTGYKGDYENILFSPHVNNPSAWMLSGNPVRAYDSEVKVAGNGTWLRKDDQQHGYLHEIGHNRDFSWWKFGGGAEETNNIWSEYLRWVLFGQWKSDSRQHKKLWASHDDLKEFVDWKSPYNKFHWGMVPFQFWYQLHMDFGWQTYLHVTKLYPKNQIKEDQDRRNWFLITLSKYLKRNMQSFLESWGFTFTEDTISKVNQLGYPKSKYSAQTMLSMFASGYRLELHTIYLNTNVTSLEKQYKLALKNEKDKATKDRKTIVAPVSKETKAVVSDSTKLIKATFKNASKEVDNTIKEIVRKTENELGSEKDIANTLISNTRKDFTATHKTAVKALDHAKGMLVTDIKKAKKKRDEANKKNAKSKTGTPGADGDVELNNEIELLNSTFKNNTTSLVVKLRSNYESSLNAIQEAKKTFVEKTTRILGESSANLNATVQQAILKYVVTTVEKEVSTTTPKFDSVIKDAENAIKAKVSQIRSNLSLVIENGTAFLDDLVTNGTKANLLKESALFRPRYKLHQYQTEYLSAIEKVKTGKHKWKLGVDVDTKEMEVSLNEAMEGARNDSNRIRGAYDQSMGKETNKTVGAISLLSQKAMDRITTVIGKALKAIGTLVSDAESELKKLMDKVDSGTKGI